MTTLGRKTRSMRARIFACAFLLAMVLGACTGDDGDPSTATQPTEPSATQSASSSEANLTPTADEITWVESICTLDKVYVAGYERLPGRTTDLETLTVEQRRARAESVWEGMIRLEEAYLAGLARITPVAGAETLQQSMVGSGEETIADLQNALDNADAIFASVEALEANNLVLEQHELDRQQKIDSEFNAHPRLLERYDTHPTCPNSRRRGYRLASNA